MNDNLPHLVYFEMKNTARKRIYSLNQDEITLIEIAICIPNSMLDSRFKNDDFSICWTVNNDVIQYDNIPLQEIIRTNKHNLSIQFKLDTYLTESINLNLSLHAKYSTFTPQEQIKQFSFFKTTIERKNISSSENSKNKEPSKKVLRFDNEDWLIPHSQDDTKLHHSNGFNKKHNQNEKN